MTIDLTLGLFVLVPEVARASRLPEVVGYYV
jgi:hypothetical protein